MFKIELRRRGYLNIIYYFYVRFKMIFYLKLTKMKKAITIVILPIFILSLSGLSSCKNRQEKKEKEKVELEQVKKIENEVEKNVYPLPTSAEVIRRLSDLDVGYIFGISNPAENAKKYFTSTKRAMNLGVYGADLSYATLYNVQQQVINFLDAIRSLTNELNMSKIYDETLYDSIKQNIDNKDELVKILKEAFNSTYANLSDNDQQPLALLVVGGAWVEGVYLTTHVSEAAYQVAGIAKVLLDQKDSFDMFLEVTKQYMNDPSIKDFVNLLEPMKKINEGLTTSLTNQNIIDITKTIEGIRSQVVL